MQKQQDAKPFVLNKMPEATTRRTRKDERQRLLGKRKKQRPKRELIGGVGQKGRMGRQTETHGGRKRAGWTMDADRGESGKAERETGDRRGTRGGKTKRAKRTAGRCSHGHGGMLHFDDDVNALG
jgi:hypothetical protein